MNKRNKILGILLILIIVLSIMFIKYISQKKYKFNLPLERKIVSVSLEEKAKNKLIGDKKELKKIFDILDKDYETRQKNNTSNNIDNKIKITFYYENDIATIIYLYSEDDVYYLEQINNGIYKIDKTIYDKIVKLF